MTPNPNPYDFVAVLAVAGGLLMSNPQLGQLLAPYATIFFAGLVGTMWSLSRRPSDLMAGHRVRGALFVLRVIGTAMVVTIPVAVWVAPKLDISQDRYLIAPIALFIGAVGDTSDWKKLLTWGLNFLLRWRSGTPESDK